MSHKLPKDNITTAQADRIWREAHKYSIKKLRNLANPWYLLIQPDIIASN